jgi:putative effector of murein hydrolase LrgA (UPF0299 family)
VLTPGRPFQTGIFVISRKCQAFQLRSYVSLIDLALLAARESAVISNTTSTVVARVMGSLGPGDGELLGVAVLFTLAAAGEMAARGLGVPVGGSVVGLVVLLAWLARRQAVSSPLERAADGLLRHMGLLFVPAGVGILVHAEALAPHLPGLLAALALGTLSGLVAAGLAFVAVSRALAARPLPSAEGVRGP